MAGTIDELRNMTTLSLSLLVEAQERLLRELNAESHSRHIKLGDGAYQPTELCQAATCAAYRETRRIYLELIADRLE